MHGAALRPRLASHSLLGAPCNCLLSYFVFVLELRF